MKVFGFLFIVGCHIWNILLFIYTITNYNNLFEYFNEYSFSVLFFNVFIYIIVMLNIFFIFFMFNTKKLKTLNEFKYTYNIQFISISLVLIFLSLAGIPPISGFLSKFLVFIHIFFKKNFIIFLLFIFLNTFSIYFYIQNLRFLISKKILNVFITKNYFVFLKSSLVISVNILNFFNISSILYVEELLFYFNLVSSYILL